MFIGHLPAGYVTSKLLYRHLDPREVSYPAFVLAGMLGAIAPDADLIRCYLLDNGRVHHHSYFTHFPVLWAAFLAVCWIWYRETDQRGSVTLWCNFALNGLIHMFLDGIVGDIRWFAPLSDTAYSLAKVPAAVQPWWLNFFLHWSMLLEAALVLWALYLWRGSTCQWRLR